ncbi:SPOR domain-containing protein [Tahibacter amnicola]|uniref:SPOR domain-containing protein n=1 Tax=Tahibacter amnicola TaxID=2976241 RepID=A0ABY6BJQ9_9GAMM|nr:SPOR domain-containing protein [Tahibacter amnicola]UXI68620.1 SPOR domain-containing protein [Tahibacter amnicola]
MAAKRKQATRTGGGSSAWPAWVWVGVGVLLGLGLAGVMWMKNWLPELRKSNLPQPNAEAVAPKASDPAVADEARKSGAKKTYDFYSVLPEKEVTIPDAELSAKARAEQQRQQAAAQNPGATTPPEPVAPAGRYILQAGSYPEPKSAEELKAKLALSGFVAKIQAADLNGKTWYRVRVGPYTSASDVESAQKSLVEIGVKAVAMKDTSAD